jgi:hypothetical protein
VLYVDLGKKEFSSKMERAITFSWQIALSRVNLNFAYGAYMSQLSPEVSSYREGRHTLHNYSEAPYVLGG